MEEIFDPIKYVGYGQSKEDGIVRLLFEVKNEIEEYNPKIWYFGFIPITETRWRYKNETKKTVSELRKEALAKMKEIPQDQYCNLYIARFYWFNGTFFEANKPIWENGAWSRYEY